jgi:hypothetical protein
MLKDVASRKRSDRKTKDFLIVGSDKYTGTRIDFGALSGRLDARLRAQFRERKTGRVHAKDNP